MAGRPHWGFSAKWVLTFSNKHHQTRFAEEVASGLRPSALVSAKKFQGVLNSAERIPAEILRFEPMETRKSLIFANNLVLTGQGKAHLKAERVTGSKVDLMNV